MNDNSLMPFGKHKGKKLANVPAQYLLWCLVQGDIKTKYPELIEYIEDNYEILKSER